MTTISRREFFTRTATVAAVGAAATGAISLEPVAKVSAETAFMAMKTYWDAAIAKLLALPHEKMTKVEAANFATTLLDICSDRPVDGVVCASKDMEIEGGVGRCLAGTYYAAEKGSLAYAGHAKGKAVGRALRHWSGTEPDSPFDPKPGCDRDCIGCDVVNPETCVAELEEALTAFFGPGGTHEQIMAKAAVGDWKGDWERANDN